MKVTERGTLSVPSPQEYLYKILVIGEFGVGKTSIIKRYTEGNFSPNYKLTIGVDFALKTVRWDSDTKINLQLWDIAGHERFGHMTRVYYKYAVAAVIVYDLTRSNIGRSHNDDGNIETLIRYCPARLSWSATFEAVLKWLKDLRDKVVLNESEPIPVILLANKCDMENTDVDTEKLNIFCHEHNLLGWFPTSAKDDINIEESMNFLMSNILDMNLQTIRGGSGHSGGNGSQLETIILDDDSDNECDDKKSGCC